MTKARYQKMYTEEHKKDMDFVAVGDHYIGPFVDKSRAKMAASVVVAYLAPKLEEKPTQTKFVKVEESIFDLKGEFERGELFTKKAWGEYVLIKEDTHLASLYEMQSHENSKIGIYRQVEIDWRDELDSYLDSISSLDSNFDEKVTLEFSKSKFAYNMSDDEFVSACHLVASLTEKPEQGVGMSSNIERMKVEHKELKEKCEALGAFIYGNEIFNSLCNLEQARMTKQLGFMDAYLRVLESRIWAAIDE